MVATEIFSYARNTGPSGKKPSSVTISARIACLSSFYRFLIRMSLVAADPCDQLERPKATPAPPRGLTAADIKKLLDVMPDTPAGLRDRAIILTLTLTGRRRSELLNLKAGDLTQEEAAIYYSYRGKGGKHGKRELPQPALQAIQQALDALGKNLATTEARRIPVTFHGRQWAGHHQRHLRRQPTPVLQSGGSSANGRPHLPPFSSQAAAGGR